MDRVWEGTLAQIARIGRYEGDPGRVEGGIRFLADHDTSGIPGNRGVVALVDRATGRAMTITFCESDQSASGSAGQASALRGEIARAFGAPGAMPGET